MKFKLEIELGNDAMRTLAQARAAIDEALRGPIMAKGCKISPAKPSNGDGNHIRDVNGNTVGKWEVAED